jgi:hypothetical protein
MNKNGDNQGFSSRGQVRRHVRRIGSVSARMIAVAGAIAFGIGLVFAGPAAGASAAPLANQCFGTDNTGGLSVQCQVVVDNFNNLDTGVVSSTTTTTTCHGNAGEQVPTLICVSSGAITSPNLVNSVTQCDGSGNGGGGTVYCNVIVTNYVTGDAAAVPSAATVNQCVGSGTDGGANPLLCNPVQSTTGATVTQCNGSGNGGGSDGRVKCTVDTASSITADVPVTVSQCNGSGNGGGGFVTCGVSLRTAVFPTGTTTVTPLGLPTLPGATPYVAYVPPVTVVDTSAADAAAAAEAAALAAANQEAAAEAARLAAAEANQLAETGVDATPQLLLGSFAVVVGAAAIIAAGVARKARA